MRLFLTLLSVALLSGCAGYTVGPIKPTPMRAVHKLCVKNATNKTLHPRVEVAVTNAIIKQFQQDGTYEISDEAHADAILNVNIEEIQRRPARSLRGNLLQSREYFLYLRGRYTVTEAYGGRVLDSRGISANTTFYVTGGGREENVNTSTSLLAADSNQDERQALPLAAEEFAVRLVSLVSEGW